MAAVMIFAATVLHASFVNADICDSSLMQVIKGPKNVESLEMPVAKARIAEAPSDQRTDDSIAMFELAWPFLDTSTEIDAWVWMMHPRNNHMYDPVLLTLGQGLKHAGANVAIVAEHTSEAMFANVTAALKRGRKPLVIAVAWHYAIKLNKSDPMHVTPCARAGDLGCGNQKLILKGISDLGAFVVLYQTEPKFNSGLLSSYVETFKVKEVWDYSRSNLDWYPESIKNISRYVPPGYAKALDLGVPFASSDARVSEMGFMGFWQWRPRDVREMYDKMLPGKIVRRGDIWTNGDTIKFLTEYPIQLNSHKHGDRCCPSQEPVEAFRMAQLLSNRACVISARSDPRDEAEWEGIVHFVEPSEMPQLLVHLGRDVRGCQTASFEKYKRYFDPEAILQRSHFLDVWRPDKH